jgi:predicted MFS family arabinose efflux permease
MAAAAGVVGANLHYSQPLLPVIALTLGTTPVVLGALPAVTQLGFAISLLVVLPLADMIDRKKLILTTVLIASVALLGQALAPNVGWLLVAAFVVGATSVAPQALSPFAASIAPPSRAGQASGMVLSGILLGVLLSKVVSGVVASTAGWQALYGGASVAMLVVAFVLWRTLPQPAPLVEKPPLRTLLTSPYVLIRAYPRLRLHSLLGILVSAMFMVFWGSYALHLFTEFGFGALIAGLFGLAGIAGSLLAPLAGRLVDRGRALLTLSLSSVAALAAFALMWVGGSSVLAIVLALIVLDAAVGIGHSTNQARIFRIDPTKRSRLNSVYMFSYFVGGAAGTGAGVGAYTAWGWAGVCAVGLSLAVVMVFVVVLNRKQFA